jgi:hypothetical protein
MTSKLTQLTEKKPENAAFLSRDAYYWMNRKIASLKNPTQMARDIRNEKHRYVDKYTLGINTKFKLGGLYFFFYNPKLKDDLPYYDVFPMVIPIEKYGDGFLGLNLHYLPIRYRQILLQKMKPLAIYDEQDEFKRLRVSYDILNASRRYKEFRPCIKRYLNTNIKSRVMAVSPEEWDVALYLPVHQFKKAPATDVWNESVAEIKNS